MEGLGELYEKGTLYEGEFLDDQVDFFKIKIFKKRNVDLELSGHIVMARNKKKFIQGNGKIIKCAVLV